MTEGISNNDDPEDSCISKVLRCKELLNQISEEMIENSKKQSNDELRVKSFGEAYRNGYKDALNNHVGWIIDIRNYLDVCSSYEELVNFKESFQLFMDDNLKRIIRSPVGLPFNEESMEIVGTIATNDLEKIGTIASSSESSYYVAGEYIVRKQSVVVYSENSSDNSPHMIEEKIQCSPNEIDKPSEDSADEQGVDECDCQSAKVLYL